MICGNRIEREVRIDEVGFQGAVNRLAFLIEWCKVVFGSQMHLRVQ